MLLKYAFIEKYLTYENITINLDNKYDFAFDPEQRLLTLTPGKDSVPDDFFAENIGISCLIGKNGCGKTYLMDFLNSIKTETKGRYHFSSNCTVVFQQNETYYVLYIKNGFPYFEKGMIEKHDGSLLVRLTEAVNNEWQDYRSFYLSSNNTNMIKSAVVNTDNDYSVGNERRYKGLHNLKEVSLFINSLPFNNELDEMCRGKHIKLVITDRWLSQLNLSELTGNRQDRQFLISQIKTFKKIFPNDKLTLSKLIFMRIITANLYKRKNIRQGYSVERLKEILNKDHIVNNYHERGIFFSDKPLFNDERLNRHIDNLSEAIFIESDKNEIQLFFSPHDAHDISTLRFMLEASISNEIIAEGYKYYIYPPFSTGQWKRVELACKINDIESEIGPGQSVNLFLDEPDADLHPEIQIQLVAWLVSLLKSKDKNKKFNVIMSTHNPLILADFPRRKVIYLGDDLVNHQKAKTLGANVYNLYKDSFLVNNVVSEFIREKIQQAIKENSIPDLSFLIGEVSEPLIVHSLTATLNKLINEEGNNHLQLNRMIDGLSESDKEFLRRRLNRD